MRAQLSESALSNETLASLYDEFGPSRWSLSDRGYLAGVHPLELWLVGFLVTRPDARFDEVVDASSVERQEAYAWLFTTSRKSTQDSKIVSLLEIEAFLEIHRAWHRLGYPFAHLVPSLATAIGSSGDRPESLAELVGVIVNGGLRKPRARIDRLRLGTGTPFETTLVMPAAEAERVLSQEVAATVQSALVGVVEKGSGTRLRNAFRRDDGTAAVVGGKTGTGDNRREHYDAKGRLLRSEVLNRTASFVFLVDDRFYGVVTSHAQGTQAGSFKFTSSLAVQLLRVLAPELREHLGMGRSHAGPSHG